MAYKTVQDVIDALKQFPRDMEVEVYEVQRITSTEEAGKTDHEVLLITPTKIFIRCISIGIKAPTEKKSTVQVDRMIQIAEKL